MYGRLGLPTKKPAAAGTGMLKNRVVSCSLTVAVPQRKTVAVPQRKTGELRFALRRTVG
jgi:hypothetical protein